MDCPELLIPAPEALAQAEALSSAASTFLAAAHVSVKADKAWKPGYVVVWFNFLLVYPTDSAAKPKYAVLLDGATAARASGPDPSHVILTVTSRAQRTVQLKLDSGTVAGEWEHAIRSAAADQMHQVRLKRTHAGMAAPDASPAAQHVAQVTQALQVLAEAQATKEHDYLATRQALDAKMRDMHTQLHLMATRLLLDRCARVAERRLRPAFAHIDSERRLAKLTAALEATKQQCTAAEERMQHMAAEHARVLEATRRECEEQVQAATARGVEAGKRESEDRIRQAQAHADEVNEAVSATATQLQLARRRASLASCVGSAQARRIQGLQQRAALVQWVLCVQRGTMSELQQRCEHLKGVTEAHRQAARAQAQTAEAEARARTAALEQAFAERVRKMKELLEPTVQAAHKVRVQACAGAPWPLTAACDCSGPVVCG